MYALYGIMVEVAQSRIGGAFEESDGPPELLALFTSEAKANAYVKSSRLKAPKKETFSAVRPFRKSSLLRYYSYAEVEEYYIPDPPVDPSL